MILYTQFPLADIRLFSAAAAKQLPRPLWPSPTPYEEFVRSFGVVKVRKRGGIRGWVGENEICDASKALRFSKPFGFRVPGMNQVIAARCAARHFHFDGLAVGKYEVILVTRPTTLALTTHAFSELLKHALHLPVSVPQPVGAMVSSDLVSAAQPLARLYSLSSTRTQDYPLAQADTWVIPHAPMLVAELAVQESAEISPEFRAVPIASGFAIEAYHTWFLDGHFRRRLWLLRATTCDERCLQTMRTFRLYLMRLNAEHECLRTVLRLVDSEQIRLEEGSTELYFLQHYFNEATRRISRMDHRTRRRWEADDVGELARWSLDFISPGQLDSLLQKLRLAKIRPQVLRKVERFANSIVIKEQVMGDKYTVGQAGAVGPHAHAHDMNFSQVWQNSGESIDLSELAAELPALRTALREEATDSEHDVAIGAIASAEASAKAGDGPGVLQHLAKAGKWALEIAQKIGVAVATDAIKQALGM